MVAIPFWLFPIQEMSEEAICVMCDADRRPTNFDTMIIRVEN